MQSHNSKERWCEERGPTENQGERRDRLGGERERDRAEQRKRGGKNKGSKEEMLQLPARVKGGKSSDGARRDARKKEKR